MMKKLKILSLNMNMFNWDNCNSFQFYLAEINPDIAVIQECKYSKIEEMNSSYTPKLPNNYLREDIKNSFHLTLALSKEGFEKKDIGKVKIRNYVFLEMQRNNFTLTGVHLPCIDKSKKENYYTLRDTISQNESTIICGDFNANFEKPNNNCRFMEILMKDNGYVSLWKKGIDEQKSYFIDYKGDKIQAQKGEFYKTYIHNRHIDYVLLKEDDAEFNEIQIDSRTLAFTDHCGIIFDISVK